MSDSLPQLGQSVGLVASNVPDRQAALRAAAEQLGYAPHVAATAADALDRLRKEGVELVLLDEEFQAEAGGENPVLKTLQWMPMAQRRSLFVALVGPDVKTLDNMAAFARSVNLVVNVNDLPQLPAILKRALDDHAQFYQVFREVLQEAGKR